MSSLPRKNIREKDLKLLWGRSGNICARCKKPLDFTDMHSITPHVIIGTQAHIEAHSSGGARHNRFLTEKAKVDYDNLILLCMPCSKIVDDQRDTYTAQGLKDIKFKHEQWVKERLELAVIEPATSVKPIVTLMPIIGYSGGANGTFQYFTLKNVSREVALDCKFYLEGFNYYCDPRAGSPPFTLDPNQTLDTGIDISTQPFYKKLLNEISANIEFSNIEGIRFKSTFGLRQTIRGKSESYILEFVKHAPPRALADTDLKIEFQEFVDPKMDGAAVTFGVQLENISHVIKISISGTLLTMFGFDDQGSIQAALIELGERKIKQMLRIGELNDYMFTTEDMPRSELEGFERYQLLRDSITL